MNAMLLRFLPMIGQPDWPSAVLYRRASDILFEFKLYADGSPVIECLGPSETGKIPLKIKIVKYFSVPPSERPLLLMELDEVETCPAFAVATFLAVSCREAGNAMKELVKS